MRLSEAIRLGSLLVEEPTQGRLYGCALGMGMRGEGFVPRKEYSHDFDSIGHNCYSDARLLWPYLCLQAPTLPCCWITQFEWPRLESAITHAFDTHVMGDKTMTLEALADQVRAWEDELEAKGINVEQVTTVATPGTTGETAAEKTEKVSA